MPDDKTQAATWTLAEFARVCGTSESDALDAAAAFNRVAAEMNPPRRQPVEIVDTPFGTLVKMEESAYRAWRELRSNP